MQEPIISISAKIDNEDDNIGLQPDEIIDKFINLVDIVVSSDNYDFKGESTVINMVTDDFDVIREGANLDEVMCLLN
jgi:tRNA A37 threonylcarbamoyladenosine synthetase subunit TsaC/SUA5/YrdC